MLWFAGAGREGAVLLQVESREGKVEEQSLAHVHLSWWMLPKIGAPY